MLIMNRNVPAETEKPAETFSTDPDKVVYEAVFLDTSEISELFREVLGD